jgi:Cytochrome C oxidase, cbb3-type, subunit III
MTVTNSTNTKSLWHKVIAVFFALLLSLVIWLVMVFTTNKPVDYKNIVEQFKYGSLGSEITTGIPYWIWRVMPEVFADKLPQPDLQSKSLPSYSSLGFIQEPGQKLPIGFSLRKVIVDRVGLNCATCHVGTFRTSPEAPSQVVAAMPSNVVNLQGYIDFISAVGLDPRFSPDRLMAAIDRVSGGLNPLESLIYRYVAIPKTRDVLIDQGAKLSFLHRQPQWGPGRVDTFNPYKSIQFNFPMDKLDPHELIGTADFPAVWNQKPRAGLQLHWDGDNSSVDERNKSASLGAGVTPTTIDLPRVQRVADWLWDLQPPVYPLAIKPELAAQGQALFQQNCASCHAFGSEKVGTVTPIEEIQTDPARLNSYTYELNSNQNTLFAGTPDRFTHFRKTNGYANHPLDGLWLRAPYLHNGSVPTVRDLLEPVDQRPTTFYRGNDLLDAQKLGFVSNLAASNGRQYFLYDTKLPGNNNTGHTYGTDLAAADKEAIVEYLKTL